MPVPAGLSYLGAEQALVDLWVESALKSYAGLDAVSPGLTQRVYSQYAPADAQYPFIVWQVASPARDIRGVGVIRVMVDTLYIVKAVAQVDSYAPLAPVARAIDSALTAPDQIAVADGFILSSVREEQFSLVEVEAGKQYRHFGGQYKIHAQAQQ